MHVSTAYLPLIGVLSLLTPTVCQLPGLVENITLAPDEEVNILSPYFPRNFPSDAQFSWFISTTSDRNVFFHFNELLLRDGVDFLFIGDGYGDGVNRSDWSVNVTGSDHVTPVTYISRSEHTWVWLVSGPERDPASERRFEIELKETQVISLETNRTAQIISKNYPKDYPNSFDQLWFVTGPSGSQVRIRFMDFDMEKGSDYLTIGTGMVPSGVDGAGTLVRYSGDFIPDDVIAPTPDVWLMMSTDILVNEDGFELKIRPTIEESNLDNYIPGHHSDILTSPYYPNSDYPDNADISWIITTDRLFKFFILFDEFETETRYDILTIGNGIDPDDTSSVIAEFSGTPSQEGVFSESSECWLRFVTDISGEDVGFSLQIVSVKSDAEDQRNITLGSNGRADIFSPNFPQDYPILINELWTITAPVSHTLLLQFKVFELEDVQYDSVTIGKGRNIFGPNSGVIGIFGGDEVPPDMEVETQYMWIFFESDRSTCFAGFWIVVTAHANQAGTPTPLGPADNGTITMTPADNNVTATSDPSSGTSFPNASSHVPTSRVTTSELVSAGTKGMTSTVDHGHQTRSYSPKMKTAHTTSPVLITTTTEDTMFYSTSTEVTDSSGSTDLQTGLKRIVVPVMVGVIFLLVAVILIGVLWRIQGRRRQPPLVDRSKESDDEVYSHANPGYEPDIANLQFGSQTKDDTLPCLNSHQTDKRVSQASIQDEPRYSTYIETLGGEGESDRYRDNESGIGSDEYQCIPYRENNNDIEFYGCSEGGPSIKRGGEPDSEVYQEIPFEIRQVGNTEATQMCQENNAECKIGYSTEGREFHEWDATSNDGMVDNELYKSLDEDRSQATTSRQGGDLYDDTVPEGFYHIVVRNESDDDADGEPNASSKHEQDDDIYDDTVPEGFYHTVVRNESDDEAVDVELNMSSNNERNDDVYDDTVPEGFYHTVVRNENDDEADGTNTSPNELESDCRVLEDTLPDDAAYLADLPQPVYLLDENNDDCEDDDDGEDETMVKDDENTQGSGAITDMNEITDEHHLVNKHVDDRELGSAEMQCGNDDTTSFSGEPDDNTAGPVNTTMVENELYRSLSVVMDSRTEPDSYCDQEATDT